jgi:hypothetical protein
MCGPTSAIGLDDAERGSWPQLRDRLRQPGTLMALMRGVLGGDTEVAAVATVTPDGVASPVALVVTPGIAAEIRMVERLGEGVWAARIGDYDVEVLTDDTVGDPRPIAVRVNPWIAQHLTVFARKLWSRRARGLA